MRKMSFHVVMVVVCVVIFIFQTGGYDYRWWGSLHRYGSPAYGDWQWFTHLLLHDNVPHLMLNMYGLAIFAAPLRGAWRETQLALLFVVSGVLGAWAYFAFTDSQGMLLGASGGVYGMMAAFAVWYPQSRMSLVFLPFSFKAKYFVTILLVYECWAQFSGSSLFGDNIAHLAHVGGALVGGLWAMLLKTRNGVGRYRGKIG